MSNINDLAPETIWAVIDTEGQPIHCSSWSEACHEHINDLINSGLDEAGSYVVRKYTLDNQPHKLSDL